MDKILLLENGFAFSKPVENLSTSLHSTAYHPEPLSFVGCCFTLPYLLFVLSFLSFYPIQALSSIMSVKTDLPSGEQDVEKGPLVPPSHDAATEGHPTTPRHRHHSPTRAFSPPSGKAAPSNGQSHDHDRASKGGAGKVIYSCFMYSFCSVSMVLTNKSLASRSVPQCVICILSTNDVCILSTCVVVCMGANAAALRTMHLHTEHSQLN